MGRYQIGVFIGRFQPFHLGHVHNIRVGLAHCDEIIILIGSSYNARTIKNPFTFAERKQMILADLNEVDSLWSGRVKVEPVSDWFYNEQAWINEVKNQVAKHSKNKKVAIVGHEKDASSYYIHCFPEWGFIEVDNYKQYNATEFRVAMFKDHELFAKAYLASDVSSHRNSSFHFLTSFLKGRTYQHLLEEYNYIKDYHDEWSMAPFEPILVMAQAVVIVNQHILLAKQKSWPGKGLWGLPGWFLDQDERVADGIFRQLIEGVEIDCSIQSLRDGLQKIEVFDYPGRALRARIISHIGLFKLTGKAFPNVCCQEGISEVSWVSLKDFWSMSEQLMDDHFQVVRKFLVS